MDSKRMLRYVKSQFEGVLAQIGGQWMQTDKFDPVSYRAVFDTMRNDLEPYRYVDVT